MGVDYSAHLVVGWPVTIPKDTEDVDEYLSPFCKMIGAHFVTEGSSYGGRLNYYIHAGDSCDTLKTISAIERQEEMAAVLKKNGLKLGPFCIKAVGHIW